MFSAFHFALWLPILAFLFGGAADALSADGGGSVLKRIGINVWEIPKGAIAPLVIGFGLGATIFEGVENGLSWQEAAAHGVTASLEALFGVVSSHHITGRGTDGRPPLGALLVVGALALHGVNGCALFTPANLPKTELVAKDIACIAEKAFLDNPLLDTACDLHTPQRQAEGHNLAEIHRAAIGSRMAALRAEVACDGGAGK